MNLFTQITPDPSVPFWEANPVSWKVVACEFLEPFKRIEPRRIARTFHLLKMLHYKFAKAINQKVEEPIFVEKEYNDHIMKTFEEKKFKTYKEAEDFINSIQNPTKSYIIQSCN